VNNKKLAQHNIQYGTASIMLYGVFDNVKLLFHCFYSILRK